MNNKSTKKIANPKDEAGQSERFKRTAQELGVEMDEDKLRESLRRMKHQDELNPPPKEDTAKGSSKKDAEGCEE